MSANIFVGAKHFGSKSLILTNKLSAEMLRPCKIEMHPPKKLAPAFAEFPEAIDLLNQLKARHRKSWANLADMEAVLGILGTDGIEI